jgi:hypothetical protein
MEEASGSNPDKSLLIKFILIKKKKKGFNEKNLLKPNYNKFVKVRMELLRERCSQPARFEQIKRKKRV